MEPRVSIIILNWNGVKDTLGCLESVYKLDYPNYEVIIVDNGSTDNSVQVIREKFPNVSLIENNRNLGYAGGNNVGMRYAIDNGAGYVWLLNNDTVVAPDSLTELIHTAKQSDRYGLLSPVIYYYDDPEKIQFCGTVLDWDNKRFIQSKNSIFKKENVSGRDLVLWGTALLIKRDVVLNTGYLNDDYFSYHEDIEYSVRAVKNGFTNVVVAASSIYHKEASSAGGKDSPFYCYFMTRNLYYFWVDNLRGLDKIFYIRKFLLESMEWADMLKRNQRPESMDACFDGLWSAIRGVTGPWDKNIRMPMIIRQIILFKPYFWIYLLRGQFRKILRFS